MTIITRSLLGAATALALGAPVLAADAPAAPAPSTHVRGTIAGHTATSIDVKTANGVVHVATSTDTAILQVVPSTRAAIKPNTFVGIASAGDAPGAAAREVVVFPDSARGMGEGHYAWDLPGGGHSMMTNGTVAAPKSMMTNGTVKTSSGANGPMVVNVAYKGGTSRITIPANAPIVTFVPGTDATVVAGAHVVIFASGTAPAALNSQAVLVGKDGLVPPM